MGPKRLHLQSFQTRSESDAYTNANACSDTDSNSYANRNTSSDPNTNRHSNADSYCGSNGDSDPNTNRYSNSNRNTNAESHTNRDSDTDRNTNADSDCHPDPNTHSFSASGTRYFHYIGRWSSGPLRLDDDCHIRSNNLLHDQQRRIRYAHAQWRNGNGEHFDL
jgi:hypothetical protein